MFTLLITGQTNTDLCFIIFSPTVMIGIVFSTRDRLTVVTVAPGPLPPGDQARGEPLDCSDVPSALWL